jgi:hypothetical protein
MVFACQCTLPQGFDDWAANGGGIDSHTLQGERSAAD